MRVLVLLLAILLAGCSPKSGGNFFPGIEEEIPLDKLDETVEVVGWFDVYVECIDHGLSPWYILAAPLYGCAVLYTADESGVHKCKIFMAVDWDFIYQHEHEHCLGYAEK